MTETARINIYSENKKDVLLSVAQRFLGSPKAIRNFLWNTCWNINFVDSIENSSGEALNMGCFALQFAAHFKAAGGDFPPTNDAFAIPVNDLTEYDYTYNIYRIDNGIHLTVFGPSKKLFGPPGSEERPKEELFNGSIREFHNKY